MAGTRKRSSPRRDAVRQLLSQLDEFHSAQELHALLHERGAPIGLATTYRILQRMADTGEVSVIHGRGHEAMYRRCHQERHGHLVCRHCRRAVEIPDAGLSRLMTRAAREHDFAEVDPTLEVIGTCRACMDSAGREGGADPG